ncbi:MAG: hypothetical protein LW806_10110 [Planctomycetaceae bacterium]|nr:hypothetical protein [Planctomycetaceae bacterium]
MIRRDVLRVASRRVLLFDVGKRGTSEMRAEKRYPPGVVFLARCVSRNHAACGERIAPRRYDRADARRARFATEERTPDRLPRATIVRSIVRQHALNGLPTGSTSSTSGSTTGHGFDWVIGLIFRSVEISATPSTSDG